MSSVQVMSFGEISLSTQWFQNVFDFSYYKSNEERFTCIFPNALCNYVDVDRIH
jgi:hypothetical protein